MLNMNQFPMLSQDDYNEYLEFQNFKKLKQQYNKAAGVGMSPQGLNLSANSSAAAAAFNFFNSAAANGGNSPLNNLNSIFPITTTSASVPSSILNQSFFNQQQQHQQQQQQQSTQIIPKVVPNGMPLTLMRQPPAASFMSPYKNVANFPGLKGGASNYAQPSPAMYQLPPALPIQSLTPKVATPNTPLNTPTTPLQHHHQTLITQTASSPPKRRPASPEIIVDDRPDIPVKKTKAEKSFAEMYTATNESFLPKLSLQSNMENNNSNINNYHQQISSSISTLPSIDSSLKTIPSSSLSSALTTTSTIPSMPSMPSMPSVPEKIVLSPTIGTPKTSIPTPEKITYPLSLPHQQQPQQPPSADSSYMDAEETHIIITARPRVPDSAERDETYTTEDDSDYDTNLRPKETPLQYKERMMVRVMDKAKRKNEASKRSREKRKREHQDRQAEKQRLEKRNMELTEKLMNLKEALKRLRPQICTSCNEQVQKFLDQCQSSKEGMNVFVLRPCKQDKCPGNKTVGRELGKFARGQN